MLEARGRPCTRWTTAGGYFEVDTTEDYGLAWRDWDASRRRAGERAMSAARASRPRWSAACRGSAFVRDLLDRAGERSGAAAP